MSKTIFRKGIEKKAMQLAKTLLKEYKNAPLSKNAEGKIIKTVSTGMGKIGKAIPLLPGGQLLGKLIGKEMAKLAIKAFKKSQKEI